MANDGENGHESKNTEATNDSSKSDIETLQIAREMGRIVIDHQIEGLDTLNKKASNTIRINILILGVVLTVFSIVINGDDGITSGSIVNGATGTGVILSGISILMALWTYTSTRKEVGLTGESLLKSIESEDGYSERNWLKGTIRAQSNWIQKNADINRSDSFILFFGHLFLFMSVGYYSFGVLWGLTNTDGIQWLYWVIIVVLAILLPILVVAPRYLTGDLVPDRVSNAIEVAFENMMNQE